MSWELHHTKEFDEKDRAWLAPALTDPFYGIDELSDEQRRGMAAIYRAVFDGERVGAMAVRIDANIKGEELVIIAAGGETPHCGGSILNNLAPCVAALAKELQTASVRAHSRVAGVQRIMGACGWKEVERVYRMEAA